MPISPRRGRPLPVQFLALTLLSWGGGASAQAPAEAEGASVEERLRRLEAVNERLAEQNRLLMERLDAMAARYDEALRIAGARGAGESGPGAGAAPATDAAVAPAQEAGQPLLPGPSPLGAMGEPASPVPAGDAALESIVPPPALLPGAGGGGSPISGYAADSLGARGEPAMPIRGRNPPIEVPAPSGEGKRPLEAFYSDGFVLGSDDEKSPYLLKTNVRMQFRHNLFRRSRDFWVNSAGDVLPILNRNDFEIERGRLSFEGFFYDPDLQYYLNLDFDTDDQHVVIAHDFWINYRFGDALDVYIGKAFVPGSREWLEGSTRTQFSDRSMATTFFRPDRSVGIWAIGEPIPDVFYRVMLANGFNTTDLTFEQINEKLAYSGSVWWDAIGDYGRGYSDLEWHEEFALRVGNSATYAPRTDPGIGFQPISEQNFVRLSDGTLLSVPGALTPGVRVLDFDIYLYAVDAALKYRGFSLSAEYYLRWLENIQGDGPLTITSLFDHGYMVQGGYFLVRDRFEVIARHSQVNGRFGSGYEYAAGLNWFINRSHYLKFTFDANWLQANPAQNSGPNLQAGETGILFRSQLQVAF